MSASPIKQPALEPVPVAASSPSGIAELQPGADRAFLRTKTLVVLGMLSGMLLSRKLWVSTRLYPLVGVVPHLPRIPYPLDYVCYAALLLLLVAIALAPRPRVYILTFVAFAGVYSLWDQTRWQPWAYQYWLMLIALGCFSFRRGDVRGERDALNICRLIMGCTYFYSGLQKLNGRFVSAGLPWVVDTLHIHLPFENHLGWVAAFIEVSIGLTLMTRRFRKIGIFNGIVMHIFILYSFGPLGRNWNSVVWPWNVVMIGLILALFTKTDATFGEIVWRNRFVYHKVVLVLFGMVPALSFFGWWPSDLSAALYNANLTQANIVLTEQAKQQLPPLVQNFVHPTAGYEVLYSQEWAFGEMNVPPYAERQSYESIGAAVCRFTNNSPDVLLLGNERSTVFGPGKEMRNTCFATLGLR